MKHTLTTLALLLSLQGSASGEKVLYEMRAKIAAHSVEARKRISERSHQVDLENAQVHNALATRAFSPYAGLVRTSSPPGNRRGRSNPNRIRHTSHK